MLYLNPPYDLEIGQSNNRRLELAFLEHTYRWLKPGGILMLIIPQPQLKTCARMLSEHFRDLTIYRLTEPATVQYKQIAELALSLLPTHDYVRQINWLFSAHAAAYIGILDAAKYDLERSHPHVKFSDTALYKETKATAKTTEFLYKDPVNATQLYRALRNLRVHFGRALAVLEVRSLVSDEPHCYVESLDPAAYHLLRRASLSDEELRRYNGYLQTETIMDVFGRMLSIIRENIIETSSSVMSRP